MNEAKFNELRQDVLGRIQALREAGQAGRADGAQMFLDGACKSAATGFWDVAKRRLECALRWLAGGEREGDDVSALGASTGRNFEIRNLRGDLVLATDSSDEVRDWILTYRAGGKEREAFGENISRYSVFTRRDASFVSVGYIHRIALGG